MLRVLFERKRTAMCRSSQGRGIIMDKRSVFSSFGSEWFGGTAASSPRRILRKPIMLREDWPSPPLAALCMQRRSFPDSLREGR